MRNAKLVIIALALLAGCQHTTVPIVIHDPTPALIAPIDNATTKITHAQTQVVTALSLAQQYPKIATLLQSIQKDLNDAVEQLADAKTKVLQFGKESVADQTSIQQQRQRIKAEEDRIKKLEADFWSVRQHRAATELKWMVGIGILIIIVVFGIVATHPGVGAVGHVILTTVTGGVYGVVFALTHGIKKALVWLFTKKATPAPVAGK